MNIALVLLGGILAQFPAGGDARLDGALATAAKVGDVRQVRALVAAGARVDDTDRRGYSALMWSAASGSVELTRFLVDSGARVNARASDGTTAIYLAAANGAADVVRLLLTRGANPAVSRAGRTARQAAAARGQTDIATLLETAETLGARLLQAASTGQAAAVRDLVGREAPVNFTDGSGMSALMFAARSGDVSTVELLLSRGADILARDSEGRGVLEWAGTSAATQSVEALLRERATTRETAGPAAAPAAPAIPDSLRVLDALLTRISAPAGVEGESHRRAVTALSEMQALAAKWPAQTPEDYRASLATDATVLSAAIERKALGGIRDALQALADDLEAKLEHCRKSGGRLGGSVLVRVRTVQAGAEAGRWQVFYMPKILEVSPSASPDLFPQLSSPTEDSLVPGRYLMWVRNPATAAVGERTVVKVGEGRKELIVDLPIPIATGK
jgi:ankyrin repeat protein